MNNSTPNRMKNDKRRPAGISRRKKKQFGFETLESRQVMSAQSPLADLASLVNRQLQIGATSYSSSTLDGQLAQLQQEMYWQSMMPVVDATAAASASRSIPTDPMLGQQWHLINSGQNTGSPNWQPIFGKVGEDINVAPVWNENIFGNGVRVAVIDSGIQIDHPDLAANLDLSAQYNSFNNLPDGGPTNIIFDPTAAHGTAVAGLIGAVANNGIGGAGVAPGVTLVPINYGVNPFGQSFYNAIYYSMSNDIDITNNSWGPPDVVRTLAGPSAFELLALRDSVNFGRDLDGPGGNPALGMIHIWAAGNGAGQYGTRPGFSGVGIFDSSNYDGYANSRYTIAVTGVDHDGSYANADGTVTNYMESGANVLVAAPTGSVSLDVGTDILVGSGLWTTDTFRFQNGRDVAGFNTSPDPLTGAEQDFAFDYWADPMYTSRMNGTSGAAPIVAGVVALMLEVNPNLSWRDVQEILVRSARQNDPLGLPSNGGGAFTQNPWITNQTPLFSEFDDFTDDPPLSASLFPTLDPNELSAYGPLVGVDGVTVYPDHNVGSPWTMTNGAGYTVAQGRGVYAEQIGYGHGVVDAELAVMMARQWHTTNQVLPSELTYTSFVYPLGNAALNLPAAERSSDDSGNVIIPGGIGGLSGFVSLWNEYFVPMPDYAQAFAYRGQSSLEFAVPPSNTMSIESVDVKLTITGNASEAMDHLRLMLVSPSGTQSDLNYYWYDDYPNPFQIQDSNDSFVFFGDPGSQAPDGPLTWTFNTNRSWGERSDNALTIDPVTNEPVIDTTGLFGNLSQGFTIGDALQQGWRLVVENWDINDTFGLQGVEIAWHGSPINAASKRIQGFVGLDDNRDDAFNFTRMIRESNGAFLGTVTATPDLTQESFVENVLVTVRRTADNTLVDQFLTGHDGNFYFDLVPDDYTITVEDPEGRLPKDDSLTPAGFLRHFQSEWQITADWFNAWDYDPNFTEDVIVDANGDPQLFLDGNGFTVANGVKNINFLLDPGAVAPQQATFTGTVYADVNGDGVFNGVDVNLPATTVFADVNRNGQRDPGEVTAVTNANGQYTLVAPLLTSGVMNIGVVRHTNWTSTNDGPGTADVATDGIETFFVRPGDSVGNVVFAMKPPANNIGGGGQAQPGILLGYVYDDANNNQSRQLGEAGAANMTVYIDANNNSVPDLGDSITTTNANGAYVFTNVAPGSRVIRIVVNSPLVQTTPAPGTGRVVTLTGSSTISDIQFGVRNTAILDFGDLPAIYFDPANPTNHARHTKGQYWLGQRVDAELAPIPSDNADGDDLLAPFDDEDGITFDPIVPGTTTRIVVTASTSGGVLQGWVDWNNDGDFNDIGERIITDKPLTAGTNQVFFSVPAGANVAQVYARFRYGENSLGFRAIGTPFGAAQLGEVEDYRLNVAVAALPQVQGLAADADQDGDVDGNDFLNWQRNVGRSTGATQSQGDSNGDDAVNGFDLLEWRHSFGDVAATAAAAQAAMAPLSTGNDEDLATLGLALKPAMAASELDVQALSSTVSVSAIGVTADGGLSPAVARRSSAEISRRPGFDLASALSKPAASLRERFAALESEADDAVSAAIEAWDVAAGDYLHQDRAFNDLLGSRRRQGLRVDGDAGTSDATEQCDEAFALLGDHLEWPRG